MLYSICIAVQAATNAASALNDTAKSLTSLPTAGTVDRMSLFELILKGGPIMIPLGILSLITIYLIFERYLFIRKSSKIGDNFLHSMRDVIHSGNLEAAKALCKNSDNPQARIIGRGISKIGLPLKDIELSMENAGRLEVYQLEKNVTILGIIAGIAPMFGFVGTILGVIKIFYNISLANNIEIGVIAGGLYEKMITSATGLSIGIIAFIAFHWLNIMINKSIQKMEIVSMDFLDMLEEETKKKS